MVDFNDIINRKNTNSLKHDSLKERFGKEDLLPLWVADMDFALPNEIYETIKNRMSHNVFGYSKLNDDFFNSICRWYDKKDISLQKENIIFSNTVVSSLICSILSFSKENDGILIQPPIYPPFFSVIKHHNRKIIINNLVLKNNRYEIDFEDLEEKIKKAKVFFLCHPQNPTGRLFDKDELSKIIDLCIKNNVILISDEIHSDIIYDKKKFHSILSFQRAKDISIVLNSASKTFNIAGFHSSYAISYNKQILKQLKITLVKYELSNPDTFGTIATTCAYTKCDDWAEKLLAYLQENRNFAIDFINKNIPILKPIKPEATYLLWIDFRDTKQSHNQIKKRLLDNAKLALNSGTDFDSTADGFFRLNLGSPKSIIEQGLKALMKEFA